MLIPNMGIIINNSEILINNFEILEKKFQCCFALDGLVEIDNTTHTEIRNRILFITNQNHFKSTFFD